MNKKQSYFLITVSCLAAILLIVGLGGGQLDFGGGPAKADAHARTSPLIEAEDLSPEAIHAAWVKSAEPPKPIITVNGSELETTSTGYSWCQPAGEGSEQSVCVTACGALLDVLPTATVAAGSEIAIQEPEGIDTLTLSYWEGEAGVGASAPSRAPSKPGTYAYLLHAKWQLEQGDANYFFALRVE